MVRNLLLENWVKNWVKNWNEDPLTVNWMQLSMGTFQKVVKNSVWI